MNPVMEWVWQHSRTRGSEKTVLMTLAARAEGCVATCTAEYLIENAGVSRRQLFRCLAMAQEELREIERLSQVGSNKRLRAFHFAKLSCAMVGEILNPLCPRKHSHLTAPVPDPRRREKLAQDGGGLFTAMRSSGEAILECEECRGSGTRMVERTDGLPGKWAVRCTHPIARIVSRQWRLAVPYEVEKFEERQYRKLLSPHVSSTQRSISPPAQQQSFGWNRSEPIEIQKARLRQWERERLGAVG
jgi:hypothetical protein